LVSVCSYIIPQKKFAYIGTLVNIGVFAAIGSTFYNRPYLRRDATAISSAVAASLGLLTLEGYAAEQYRKTPRGQEEERRAKREGAIIFQKVHEHVMRPDVLGGIVGLGESLQARAFLERF